MVELTLIGTDFRQVAPSRLEVLAKRTEHIRANLVDLREQGAIRGGVLVSTCNRIEAVLDLDAKRSPDAGQLPQVVLGCPDDFPVHAHSGRDSVEHLLQVATGLDSMVLGEEQILGQVGRAFQVSEELGLMSRPLHMLRTRLLAAARELRQRTGLGRTRSVASLAADRLVTAGPRLAVVGAGETARIALEVLARRGVTDVLVVNRTLERAEALARHFGGRAMGLQAFRNDPPAVDGILYAVHSPVPLFGPDDAPRVARGLKMVVDVSQPTVLEPGTAAIDGLTTIDLDALADIAAAETADLEDRARAGRAQVRARAEQIWNDLAGNRAQLGKVVDLHVENALAELDRALSGPLRHLADTDRERLRRVMEKTARRNAHFHLQDLRRTMHA